MLNQKTDSFFVNNAFSDCHLQVGFLHSQIQQRLKKAEIYAKI